MEVPLQIQFHNMDPSQAIEDEIRKHAAKLDKFSDRLISMRVNVEAPHRRQRKGMPYHVVVDIEMPGAEVVASRDQGPRANHEDVHVAIRDAFDVARRRLQDYKRKQKRDVKHHEEPARGRIVELHPEMDYGRLESEGGREIYFHRNSVTGADFEELQTGFEVLFGEEAGAEGPQATFVHVMNRDRIVS